MLFVTTAKQNVWLSCNFCQCVTSRHCWHLLQDGEMAQEMLLVRWVSPLLSRVSVGFLGLVLVWTTQLSSSAILWKFTGTEPVLSCLGLRQEEMEIHNRCICLLFWGVKQIIRLELSCSCHRPQWWRMIVAPLNSFGFYPIVSLSLLWK